MTNHEGNQLMFYFMRTQIKQVKHLEINNKKVYFAF